MMTAASATGKIRKYQLWVTMVGCLVFPLTWMAFKLGYPAIITYVIYIAIYMLLIFVRLHILKGLLDFPVMPFIRQVICRLVFTSIVAFIIPCGIIYSMNSSILRLCIVFAVSFLSTCVSICLLGLEQDERAYFISKFKNIMLKFNKV